MLTKSKKAKGRRLQNKVANDIRSLLKTYFPNIKDGDVSTALMGQSGVDIILSPRAKEILDLCVECKNNESLNVSTTFVQHYDKYKDNKALKLLVHSRNRCSPQVTMKWEDFMRLLELMMSCLPMLALAEATAQLANEETIQE